MTAVDLNHGNPTGGAFGECSANIFPSKVVHCAALAEAERMTDNMASVDKGDGSDGNVGCDLGQYGAWDEVPPPCGDLDPPRVEIRLQMLNRRFVHRWPRGRPESGDDFVGNGFGEGCVIRGAVALPSRSGKRLVSVVVL